jgi:2'-5' RNA ligase
MIRTFIALELNDSIRDILGGIIRQMAQELPPIRWVDPKGIHLTLAFLGDLTDEQVAKARQAAEATAQQVTPFRFHLSHLGVFDSSQYPRVIWVGVNEPSGALQQLHSLLNRELEHRGFAVERRVFSPHLTLARIKVPLNPEERQRLLRLLVEIKVVSSPLHAGRLRVMRSELLRSGARYTSLGEYVLGEGRK